MSLNTFSRFLYGFRIQANVNDTLDFDEGAGELQATISPGGYSIQQLAAAIETALNALGDNTYTVVASVDTRRFTITADGNFDLLAATGSRIGTGVWDTIGFSAVDLTGASSYISDFQCGTVYEPQFILQDYLAAEDNISAVEASINESANGDIEVITYGNRSFVEANIRFATDIEQPKYGPIRNNPTGVQDLRDFMSYATQKLNFDFSPDVGNPGNSLVLLLESTPASSEGVGYRLEELYNRGAPGYFDTGVMRFRKVNL